MKGFFFIVSFFIVSNQALADLPSPAFKYDKFSNNGQYSFTSTPFGKYHNTNLGSTQVYDSDNNLLYTIDRYFPTPSFISDDGTTIVTIAYSVWTKNKKNIPIIEFYKNQDSLTSYFLGDIVKEYDSLLVTESYTSWYANYSSIQEAFVDSDTLFISTLEKNTIKLSMLNGEIFETITTDEFGSYYNLSSKPTDKEKTYWDYPPPPEFIFQNSADMGIKIFQPQMMHFYWGYNNPIEIYNCLDCDSSSISLRGASFKRLDNNSGIVMVSRGTRKTQIFSWEYKNGKKMLVDSIEVEASPLPKPNIYLSFGKNYHLDFEDGITNLRSLKNWEGIVVQKNRFVPGDYEYEIEEWSLEINGMLYQGQGNRFSEEVKVAFKNLVTGDKVTLLQVKYSHASTPRLGGANSNSTFTAP